MKCKFTGAAGIAIATATVMFLAGCADNHGSDNKVLLDRANAKIAKLEDENSELKTRLEELSSQDAGKPPGGTLTIEPEKALAGAAAFNDLEDLSTRKFVYDLASIGVFDGLGSRFQPFSPISRGEFIEWAFKAHNAVQPDDSNKIRLAPQLKQQFSDLLPDNHCYKYAQALANAGYSVGYDDGSFRPEKPITREEMIGIKLGMDAGKLIKPDPSQMAYVWGFSDSKDVDKRFTGYVHADYYADTPPYGTNIQRAFGKVGTFKPKEPVLRNEAAAALWASGKFANIHKTTAGHAVERLAKKG